MSLSSLALLVPLLLSATPLTDDTDFIRAQALYADLEFESAMQHLKRAAAQPYTAEERARLEVWMGMCSAQLRDDVGVRAHFAQAVTLDVDVDVPGFAPPKVVELLEQARTEQRKRLIEQLAARSGTAEGAERAGTTEGAETAEAAKTATDRNVDDKSAGSPNRGSERAPNDDGAPAQVEQASEGAAAPSSTDQTASAPTVADTNLLPWTAASALGLGAVALGVVAVGLTGAGVYFATLYASPDAYQGEAFRNGLIAQALWIAAAGAGLTMLGAAIGAGGSVVWALAE